MISGEVDLKALEADLTRTASAFGEANETGIARWGVSTVRRLVTTTQVWGDGSKPKKTQEASILKDANRVIFAVSKPNVVKMLETGKMRGLIINGQLVKFQRHQLLKTPDEVYNWIEKNRDKGTGKTRRIRRELKCVATDRNIKAASKRRNKDIGKAKGGWIGAGLGIAKYQKSGSRITIGKNVSSYAHKWKGGGRASMKRSTWTPEGMIENLYKHVAFDRVLSKRDIDKAVLDGAKNTISWYEKAMNARLNRKK